MNKKSEAQARYDSANTIRVALKLNKKTDAAIIEKLDEVQSKQGYIKQLIKEDLQATQGQKILRSYARRGYEVTDVRSFPGSRLYTMTAIRKTTARDPFGNATGAAEEIKEVEVTIYDDGEVTVDRIH